MNNEEKIMSMLETLVIKVDKLEQGQVKLEQEVQAVKEITLRMEHEHGQQLKALFDGYSGLYDISESIRKDVVSIQGKQQKQDLHIAWLNSQRKAE